MSIATEIEKLKTNITSAYNSIEAKNGTIPTNKNTDNLSEAISSISTGIEIKNGVVDSNYYTSSGVIQSGTFVNIENVTDFTDFTTSYGDIIDVCKIDASKQAVLTVQSSGDNKGVYILITNRGEVIKSLLLSELVKSGESQYGKIATNNGVNILVGVLLNDSATHLFHITYENDTLTNNSNKSLRWGTNYDNIIERIDFLLENTAGVYFTAEFVEGTQRIYVITLNKTQKTISLSTSSYSPTFTSSTYLNYYGGCIPIDEQYAIVSYTNFSSSGNSANTKIVKYTTTGLSSYTNTQDPAVVNPYLFKIGNRVLLFNRNITTNELIVNLHNESGTYQNQQVICSFGNGITSNNFKFKVVKISESLGLIAFDDIIDTKHYLTYIPFKLENNIFTFASKIQTSQDGSNLTSLVDNLVNTIIVYLNNQYTTGDLTDLSFAIGKKYVSIATEKIDGLTKTDCSDTVSGDVYLLSK